MSSTDATGRAPRPFAGGGHAAVAQGDKVYLFGGFDASAAGQVQIYDPTADSWSTGSAMPWNAGGCVAAEVDGMIYVGGGVAPGGGTVSNFASYDPQADSWTALAALPTKVPPGRVLVGVVLSVRVDHRLASSFSLSAGKPRDAGTAAEG